MPRGRPARTPQQEWESLVEMARRNPPPTRYPLISTGTVLWINQALEDARTERDEVLAAREVKGVLLESIVEAVHPGEVHNPQIAYLQASHQAEMAQARNVAKQETAALKAHIESLETLLREKGITA
jgi:hypothetical protein